MRLEFLPEGSPDCPLIRLFSFDRKEAVHLRDILKALAAERLQEVDLHREPGIEAIDSCRLILRVDRRDRGILSNGPLTFECLLSSNAWEDMAGLVEPFCESDVVGYQWLTRTRGIKLLLSKDGAW